MWISWFLVWGTSTEIWACSCLGFLDSAGGGKREFVVCDLTGFRDFLIWELRVSAQTYLARVLVVFTFAPTSRRAVADSVHSRCAGSHPHRESGSGSWATRT